MKDSDIFAQLDKLLADRRKADPAASYTASLYAGGTAAMTAKVAEESAEVVEAARQMSAAADADHLVHEVADLWFHCMVLLHANDLAVADVQAELARRFGISGLEEKAARTTS